MKLVACPRCHAQFDVAGVNAPSVRCPCGATIPVTVPPGVDAPVTRCAACGALVAGTDAVCGYCGAAIERKPEAAGPVCPECYARNPAGARHCVSCGVAFVPQAVRPADGRLRCPACPDQNLVARLLGGIWVDECPGCLGLWTPGDAMDRLVERIRAERRAAAAAPGDRERRSAWREDVSYRHCPECQAMMQRRNFGHRSGVIVDWCASHGTWLDAHEMEDIAAFVLQGGLDQGPAGGPGSGLPVDPGRAATLAAAERILAEERARASRERGARGGVDRGSEAIRGLGDLLASLLK
jgi:Zn-finger nucleic acid-binding protein